jgi:hypothetical protein
MATPSCGRRFATKSDRCSAGVNWTNCHAIPEVIWITAVAADLREKRVSTRTRVLRRGPWKDAPEAWLVGSLEDPSQFRSGGLENADSMLTRVAGGELRPVDRKGDYAVPFARLRENADPLAADDVPKRKVRCVIVAASKGQCLAVGGELHNTLLAGRTGLRLKLLARRHVPVSHRRPMAGRHQRLAIGREDQGRRAE